MALIKKSGEAVKTFEADSITSQLNSHSHFFLANRLVPVKPGGHLYYGV